MKRRKIEMTIETEHFFMVQKTGPSTKNWCGDCKKESLMVTPFVAAKLCDVSTRDIYRWVELHAVHFQEEPDEPLFVCLSSLITNAFKEKGR